MNKMNKQVRVIGGARITRVEELDESGFYPMELFPGLEHNKWAKHLNWLTPNFFDTQTGRLKPSIHVWLIQLGSLTVLIDPAGGNDKHNPKFPRFNQRSHPFLERLYSYGIKPEDVDLVICTHLHVDHIGWNTVLENGTWTPTFPNARYIFSREEYEHWKSPEGGVRHLPSSMNAIEESVDPVVAEGLVDLVANNARINKYFSLIPAPGHTKGHIAILLETENQKVLFTGDVMHSPYQIYETDQNSCFCEDAVRARQTRKNCLDFCAEQNALLMPAHFGFPHAGWISRSASGFEIEFDYDFLSEN